MAAKDHNARWYAKKKLDPIWVAMMNARQLARYHSTKLFRLEKFNRKVSANPVWKRLRDKKTECREKCLKFDLTEEWFLAHFSQGCEVTGHGGDYVQSNCRIACAIYNRARMNYTDAEVVELAQLLASK